MYARRGVYTHDVVYSNNKWQWVYFWSQFLLVNKFIYRRLYLDENYMYLVMRQIWIIWTVLFAAWGLYYNMTTIRGSTFVG